MLRELEKLLENKNSGIEQISLSHSKVLRLRYYGSSAEKAVLTKKLKKFHLKFERGSEYCSKDNPDMTIYEISAVDGEGNEILSNYIYKHKKKEGNPFRKI